MKEFNKPISPMEWTNEDVVNQYLSVHGEEFNLQIPEHLNLIGDLTNKVFVDIGAGTGELLIQASKQAKYCTGIDISPLMCRYARGNMKHLGIENATIICRNIIDWKPEPERFDTVWSNKTIHHIEDEQKMELFRTIYKSLRQGGRFIVQDVMFSFNPDENKEKLPEIMKAIHEMYKDKPNGGIIEQDIRATLFAEHPIPSSVIKKLIENAGFKIIGFNQKTSLTAVIEAVK